MLTSAPHFAGCAFLFTPKGCSSHPLYSATESSLSCGNPSLVPGLETMTQKEYVDICFFAYPRKLLAGSFNSTKSLQHRRQLFTVNGRRHVCQNAMTSSAWIVRQNERQRAQWKAASVAPGCNFAGKKMIFCCCTRNSKFVDTSRSDIASGIQVKHGGIVEIRLDMRKSVDSVRHSRLLS